MSNKVILVTGSNSGIGYELVHLLAAKGHTVYLASRNESAGRDAVAKIKSQKKLDVKYVQLDVTDIDSVKAAEAHIKKAEGRLQILVNNAGTGEIGKPQRATEVDIAVFRAAFEANFFGLIQTTATLLPLIRASSKPDEPCVILNVSTDMASNSLMASPRGFLHELAAYNTSKAAVNSYTIALARELQAEGIKVNCVTPGFTSTALNDFREGGKTAEQAAEVLLKWSLLGKNDKTGMFVNDAGEFPW
ncbi:oxidoreductase [Mycena galopus ATCC 62051]|nr:oxidoreductase [Mycena galopus ATCC 62051]